jgi:DNA modification methylase
MPNNNYYRKKDSAKLVWDTKPRRAPNPKDIEFQTAEVVIPNPKEAGTLPLSFRDQLLGEAEIDKQKMNRLIWGDNLLAMQALLAQGYEGKINLIYIDPPFDSKADYSCKLKIAGEEFTKEPSVIERLAYKDTWAGGTDSYLDMLYPRLQLMKRLLAPNGSIYVHLDWHVGHYIKVIMDEIFGKNNFRNEIIWFYPDTPGRTEKDFNSKHDNILRYGKSENYIFNADEVREEILAASVERYKKPRVLGGREYIGGKSAEIGKVPEDVWRIPSVKGTTQERTNYSTQKPEKLLERIIKVSSNEGDLIADFFCGSGTTLAVAEKLGRRWIGCELGKVGIQVSRGRLVEMGAKPFLIENIGNYQRQMIYLSGGRIWEMQKIILKLYDAEPRKDYQDLGVKKDEKGNLSLVYVGYPDRPVTARKVEELAKIAETLDGSGYKNLIILGWDYEYNYEELLEQRLKNSKDKIRIKIESRTIPPEIYDYLKQTRDEEEIEPLKEKIHFYEKPYLRLAEPKIVETGEDKAEVSIKIDRYVIFDWPIEKEKDREKIIQLAKNNFAILIDYWAIDWDYDGFTFKSEMQAMRGLGRRVKIVPIEMSKILKRGKEYKIAVRVVDIFGNDATSILEIDLK